MADRRSLETREKIEKNFISLLEKKSINNITITEITKLAGINRRTFYVYYEDIYDLRNQIEKKF